MFTIVSFAAMMIATAHVLRTNWPANGMPLLAWQSHVGAIVAMLIEITTRALKIQASAHAIGAPIPFATSLRVCLAGDFAAAITPARSGAEPARFLVLAEAGVSASARVIILFLELLLEMISLALVCVVLAILFSGRGASARAPRCSASRRLVSCSRVVAPADLRQSGRAGLACTRGDGVCCRERCVSSRVRCAHFAPRIVG